MSKKTKSKILEIARKGKAYLNKFRRLRDRGINMTYYRIVISLGGFFNKRNEFSFILKLTFLNKNFNAILEKDYKYINSRYINNLFNIKMAQPTILCVGSW